MGYMNRGIKRLGNQGRLSFALLNDALRKRNCGKQKYSGKNMGISHCSQFEKLEVYAMRRNFLLFFCVIGVMFSHFIFSSQAGAFPHYLSNAAGRLLGVLREDEMRIFTAGFLFLGSGI